MDENETTRYLIDHELLYDVRRRTDASNIHHVESLLIAYKSIINKSDQGHEINKEREYIFETVVTKLRIFASTGIIVRDLQQYYKMIGAKDL